MIQKILSPLTTASRPELVKRVQAIMADTSIQGIVGALQGMRDRPDSTPMLPKIECPSLIIHGLDDQLIPIKEAESMNEQIPEANLVVLPEAGHLPNLEQPDKYNLAIRNFVLSIT
jgi:pimeloyl-ACP methyl ester carboxylesterase